MSTTWVAPGRVNLIGEHVDYNDGVVLPFALPFATTTTVSRRDDGVVEVMSEGMGSATFAVGAQPGDVDDWAAYVAGVVWALSERGHEIPGLDVSIKSDVPLGAGLSSSAALTCSVGAAVSDEFGLELSRTEIASVARQSENDFAGAPTGLMDQLASMLGEDGHALLLDCRSLETRPIPLTLHDFGLTLLLVDTMARHQLVGSEYADRRSDCEAAAGELGLESLRDASLSQLGDLSSDVLKRRTHHVIAEIQRVKDVVAHLDAGHPADIGAYLSASHESLREDFEVSCDELDVAVEAALSAGALGARMTGGGFGGCVIGLCRDTETEAIKSRVRDAFADKDWAEPTIWVPRPSAGAHRLS